jgi:hypothetical protein
MNTQTPSGDVSVTAPGCAACGAPLPAGRSRRFCSPACRQAASAGATKALRLKPRCSAAAHGCKAPSINARIARPATWPSNGAMSAHDPANASALVVSAHAARR